MEAKHSVTHQEKRDVCASYINDCEEMAATSDRDKKSQATSKQNTMIPVRLRHVVPKQVLSSLPVRERPSRRRTETEERLELDPPGNIIFFREAQPQDQASGQIATTSQPAQAHTPVSGESAILSKYERRCV